MALLHRSMQVASRMTPLDKCRQNGSTGRELAGGLESNQEQTVNLQSNTISQEQAENGTTAPEQARGLESDAT